MGRYFYSTRIEAQLTPLLRSTRELDQLRAGEVLVCPATSSAWMLVFHRAGALITEGGSALSHTAIVAREHALPAVVGVPRATFLLETGDEVVVDGNRGTVTRCARRGALGHRAH